MSDTTIVLLFIKAPVRGRVKSRLASVIGDETAVELYRNFILDILDSIERSGHPLRIFVHPSEGVEFVSSWLGKERVCLPQTGSDLGERMEHALRQAFSEGWSRAVLIGSDLPDLPPAIISEAFTALDESDAVIGPAIDGGYYLIGFNGRLFPQRLFHAVEWSTSGVFRRTLELLQKASLRIHVMPQWRDVDTIDDLRALFERGQAAGSEESRTMAYLRLHKDILF